MNKKLVLCEMGFKIFRKWLKLYSINNIELIFQIFFDISVVLETIILIYEINVKLIWSVNIFF